MATYNMALIHARQNMNNPEAKCQNNSWPCFVDTERRIYWKPEEGRYFDFFNFAQKLLRR